MNIKLYFLKIRDFIISNYFVNIYSIKYKNKYYDIYNNYYIYFLLLLFKIIPFYFIKNICQYFNISLIYNFDNIYYITSLKKNYHILPIISKFAVINNLEMIDLTSNIKYYSSNIPVIFILKNNNIIEYNTIHIKYIKLGEVINKQILLNEYYINTQLYNLFK